MLLLSFLVLFLYFPVQEVIVSSWPFIRVALSMGCHTSPNLLVSKPVYCTTVPPLLVIQSPYLMPPAVLNASNSTASVQGDQWGDPAHTQKCQT